MTKSYKILLAFEKYARKYTMDFVFKLVEGAGGGDLNFCIVFEVTRSQLADIFAVCAVSAVIAIVQYKNN